VRDSAPLPWGNLLVMLVLAATLLGWQGLLEVPWSPGLVGLLVLLPFSCALIGDLVLRLLCPDRPSLATASTRVVLGASLLSVLLFAAAWLIPLSLPQDLALCLAITLALWWPLARERRLAWLQEGALPECLCVLTGAVAITLWCGQLLTPPRVEDAHVTYTIWQDVFTHAAEITALAGAHGPGTVHDVKAAGVTPVPYHLASYLLPALVMTCSGLRAMTVYAAFYVPFGLLLSVLAAYALAASLFGRWPALAAGAGLAALPDAWQQGFGQPIYAYHWLQQANPAGPWGVACAAAAFLLLNAACEGGARRLVPAGYLWLGFTLLFKAQVFVAVAAPAFLFPMAFLPGLTLRRRLSWMAAGTAIFIGVVTLARQLPHLPQLRLDGSGLDYMAYELQRFAFGPPGEQLRRVFAAVGLPASDLPRGVMPVAAPGAAAWPVRALTAGGAMLLYGLGWLPVCWLILSGLPRADLPARVRWFPAIALAVLMVMWTGLALDHSQVGALDEFQHRPMIWAWFVLAVWCPALAWCTAFGDAAPRPRMVAWCLSGALLALALLPWRYADGLHGVNNWGRDFMVLPACTVRLAEHVRTHSAPDEILQDAENDPILILSALSERAPYAVDSHGTRAPPIQAERLEALARLRAAPDWNAVLTEAHLRRIGWYYAPPGVVLPWAAHADVRPVRECAGYRLFHF
jgi:hypothetical protein